MKRLLLSAIFLTAASPAVAQEAPPLSMVQQYLYGETGYAPGAPAPATAPEPQNDPYDTAYAPEETEYLPEESLEEDHLNEGVRGMNF